MDSIPPGKTADLQDNAQNGTCVVAMKRIAIHGADSVKILTAEPSAKDTSLWHARKQIRHLMFVTTATRGRNASKTDISIMRYMRKQHPPGADLNAGRESAFQKNSLSRWMNW